ncbi:MAG: T9SS type A sorting domain-containing protein [Chitinophagaceae bacterium]|nr:T9SS type A sorting domain-containing protein [Chitinophagaceae bacterium]
MKRSIMMLLLVAISFVAKAQKSTVPAVPKLLTGQGITEKFKWVAYYPPARRYDLSLYNTAISVKTFEVEYVPLWQDSTMLRLKAGAAEQVKYSSVAQTFFVADSFWNDSSNPLFMGWTPVYGYYNYQVDSVHLMGYYLRGARASATIVDTLLVSVAYQPASNTLYHTASADARLAPYLPTGKDTLYATAPTNVDTALRMALPDPTSAAGIVFKVPLTDAMRVAAVGTGFIPEFSFKLPSPLLVPCCNNIVVVSYTFVSGDTWLPNTDTIDNFHHFLPAFVYPKAGATGSDAARQTYSYYAGDHSMSSVMDAKRPTHYTPTILLGAQEDSAQWKAHYLANSISVFSDKWPIIHEWVEDSLAIGNLSMIEKVKVYPNPTSDDVHFAITTKQNISCSLLLTNVLGQQVAERSIGNVVAGKIETLTINLASCSKGVYFYKIVSGGKAIYQGKLVKE